MPPEKKTSGPDVEFSHPAMSQAYRDAQEWMSLWQGIWEENMLNVTRVSTRFEEGRLDPRGWMDEATRAWSQWASYLQRIALFPVTRAVQKTEGIASLVFHLDRWAEGADAKELPVGVTLGQGVTLAATPLRQLGGSVEMDPVDRLELRLSEDRSSIRVALRNVKGDGVIPPMGPGHYLSLLTASDPPKHRPLAMLHVLVDA
jgi:hypothetical protein